MQTCGRWSIVNYSRQWDLARNLALDCGLSSSAPAASEFVQIPTEALVGLPERDTPTFWGKANSDTSKLQPVATKGVHHRRCCSFRKVREPTRRQIKTVRLKKDGQKNMPG